VCGGHLRLITGGLPHLKGDSIAEKKVFFETRFDHIRKMLIFEPRGHDNMFGAVLFIILQLIGLTIVFVWPQVVIWLPALTYK